MNDPCRSHATSGQNAALDDAAFGPDGLADELALLASALDGHGCPCVAAAFRQAARRRRVQNLLETALAVAARVV
ncbi:hypothetical protein KBI52_16115 [Microvirga sp. HBU67558]|uniref:hypothetical protein n=1 Tax=Microvirga TaxID=186650 RepID=UPI00156FF609|nr:MULTISPECIES: hypothetical protein [unclassified Microvirga]MBQ0821717.1 hypothetical protein [Microvirga sp. HBU67558]